MGYTKSISYSNYVELYEYEQPLKHNGRGRTIQKTGSMPDMAPDRENSLQQREPDTGKREDNAQRTKMAFRRLVSANLGKHTRPLLISLTYAENNTDIRRGHKDFNAFARALRYKFGKQVRYIAVPEFQKRGAVHFHALFWGLPNTLLAKSERATRLVARTWGHGFIDLVATDGDHKISGYLAKYMGKAFLDPRLKGCKAYVASRNIIRPQYIKNPLLTPLFYGGLLGFPDLSTAELLRETNYMTQWLGKGRYRLFEIRQKED